jgi:acyl carrier protein
MSTHASPTARTEDAVLTVLRETIGDDTISTDDDFYQVGGHSLLILRVTKRLRAEFGLELDLRQFWTNAQVAALISACRPVTDPADPTP